MCICGVPETTVPSACVVCFWLVHMRSRAAVTHVPQGHSDRCRGPAVEAGTRVLHHFLVRDTAASHPVPAGHSRVSRSRGGARLRPPYSWACVLGWNIDSGFLQP